MPYFPPPVKNIFDDVTAQLVADICRGDTGGLRQTKSRKLRRYVVEYVLTGGGK